MTVTVRPPCDEGAILAGCSALPSSGNSRWILAATILGSSMAFIDGTVVNVALSALQTALHATVSDIQWVVEAYALLLASLLLVGGSLGDRYGRRKIFILGVVLFGEFEFAHDRITWLGEARQARVRSSGLVVE